MTTAHQQVSDMLSPEVDLSLRQRVLAVVGELEARLAEQRATNVQIVHTRHPDDGCYHDVFVGGAPIPADRLTVEDIDPGRGTTRSSWNERLAEAAKDETPFGRALYSALEQNADSEYIDEDKA